MLIKWFNWERINKIGKIKLLKSAFIIFLLLPIVTKILSHEQLYNIIPRSFFEIYYSTLFITIGIIFYEIFCPEFIKKYETFEDFKKSGRGGPFLKRQWNHILIRNEFEDVGKSVDNLVEKYKPTFPAQKENIKKILNDENIPVGDALFWFVHECLNCSRHGTRLVCLIFYFIGFAILLIFFGEKVYNVTTYLFQTLQTSWVDHSKHPIFLAYLLENKIENIFFGFLSKNTPSWRRQIFNAHLSLSFLSFPPMLGYFILAFNQVISSSPSVKENLLIPLGSYPTLC